MSVEVIEVTQAAGFAEALRRAEQVLADDGLVAFPTETVYGVGARVDRPGGMARLRSLKDRPADRAFTVHIGSKDDAHKLAPDATALANRLMRKGWPGPLTLILDVEDPAATPAMAGLNGSAAQVMYYRNTIGLRYPDDAVAEALLRAVASPIVAASANRAGGPPPRSADEILAHLGQDIDLLLDAGETRYRQPSTIVRVRGGQYELLREGVYDAGILARLATLRIVFVCTGNTCRSPMAQGFAQKLIAEKLGCPPDALEERGVFVESTGTAGGPGGASEGAIAAMASRGIDITKHHSSRLNADLIRQADYVFAMTEAHRRVVIDLVPSTADRVHRLLPEEDVADPMGGGTDDYEACALMIERGVRARLEETDL